ncbi:uncharacterized protein LOC130719458 [Lotus japonicus]|uniref:uncharacterized protein LOC130719458 n=1 Tax=Lotus japonicus TaxID=34305 RepID=UPI002590165D|nr:uncharacterized protein LOC130719458 [Lotus japonicus]
MARRQDQAIANALQRLADILERNENHANGRAQPQVQVAEEGEYQGLNKFLKRNPSQFKGGYNPDGAHLWIKELERIFGALQCSENQKRLENEGREINWFTFKEIFLEKYLPKDVRNKKEMEFLELKQGNMSVGEYAAKFEELALFYLPYQAAGNERSKCVKFENGLRPEIKEAIGYQRVRDFPTLVDMCRIFEDDHKSG